ncbi:hypothetical protein EYC58_03900 [Candidatus Saccharibacteria bacterium]|nr:MAG: hypothetical protein EYC58_03900 [Candidatus Saccharibacteria bacterium]
MKFFVRFRLFLIALGVTLMVVIIKYSLHLLGWELVEQTSLHNSVVSSVVFVIGFVLSATITDYKESERIPAEFASVVEDMYEDAREIKKTYPTFDLELFRKNLIDILGSFREGTRVNRTGARREIHDLNITFGEMEKAGVPPNFVVKLKQQQAQLLRSMYRVNYIQKIRFIPSAFFLVRALVILVVGLLLLTDIDPFYGGLLISGIITFIMTYMLLLIQVISVPFHPKGATKDDVSLFLLREAAEHLRQKGKKKK